MERSVPDRQEETHDAQEEYEEESTGPGCAGATRIPRSQDKTTFPGWYRPSVNMCVYASIQYIFTYIYIYIYTSFLSMPACMQGWMYGCMYVCVCVCVCMSMCMCKYSYMHMCSGVCVCVCVYTYIYIYDPGSQFAEAPRRARPGPNMPNPCDCAYFSHMAAPKPSTVTRMSSQTHPILARSL